MRESLPRWAAAIVLIVAAAPARADVASGPDTVTLSLDSVLARVRAFHPTVRQAAFAAGAARAEERAARGAFDPVVSASWQRKTFGGTPYYDYGTAKLTVPTPLGADVVLGVERARGRYASPDRRTPDGGLASLGIAVPLGQRLLTDERRTGVAVARAQRALLDADQALVVNRAMLDATREYARWYEAVRRADAAREGVDLAAFRLDGVRRRVAAGEAAALDTVEAALEVRRREVARIEADQAVVAARLALGAHLWNGEGAPDEVGPRVRPVGAAPRVSLDTAAVAAWLARAERAHPDVRRVDARLAGDEAQRRLVAQQRLPALDVELTALGTDARPTSAFEVLGDGGTVDGKVGAALRMPLLLRRERGRAESAALRVEQQRIEQQRVRLVVAIGVRRAVNDLSALDAAIEVQREAVAHAARLRDGEQRRYEAGEGTLFLVNTRERAVLEERLRLAALEARRLTAWGELVAATAT